MVPQAAQAISLWRTRRRGAAWPGGSRLRSGSARSARGPATTSADVRDLVVDLDIDGAHRLRIDLPDGVADACFRRLREQEKSEAPDPIVSGY
jgi:hypothetical protein